MLGEALAKLLADESLREEEACRLLDAVFTGEAPQAQVAAVLALLARRGPTVE
ncbi:MAG: anthranilate phosphoribosyltransferase, partial [Planctomycetota bacterium]